MFGGYLGSESLQCAKTLIWHSPKRHNFFHLTIQRHQNIKMVACKLSKNYCVMPSFVSFRFVRDIFLVTVVFYHPVVALLDSVFNQRHLSALLLKIVLSNNFSLFMLSMLFVLRFYLFFNLSVLLRNLVRSPFPHRCRGNSRGLCHPVIHLLSCQSQGDREEVWIIKKNEKDQVGNSGHYRDKDDIVEDESLSTDRDDLSVGEIPFEDERGHVDNKVEGVEANHEVSDRWCVLADRPIDAENIGVSHIERRSQVLNKLSAF